MYRYLKILVRNRCSAQTKQMTVKRNKKLSYRLENRAAALSFRLSIMLLSEIWLFEFNYTLRVGFLANLHGNGRTRVYKNSTHCQLLTPPRAKTVARIRINLLPETKVPVICNYCLPINCRISKTSALYGSWNRCCRSMFCLANPLRCRPLSREQPKNSLPALRYTL